MKLTPIDLVAGTFNDVAYAKSIGKLQDVDHDFEMVWRSHQANQMRGATRNCFCTHGCYLSENIEYTATGQPAMLRKL